MARWKNLSNKQKKKFGSKGNFKAAKKENRRSGGDNAVVRQIVKRHKAAPQPASLPPGHTTTTVPIEGRGSRGNTAGRSRKRVKDRELGRPSQVTNINDYDTTSYGRGNRKAADRLSGADLRELHRQGFSKQEIIDYSAKKVSGGTKQGRKAQSLLEQWKASLTPPKQAPQQQQEAPKQFDQRPQNVTQTINSGGGGSRERDYKDVFRPIDPVRPSPGQPPTAPPNRGPVNGENNVDQKNEQNFEVNQDNDVNTNITGDGNTVTVNQDNSVRQYGGNQRNFTYISQGGNQAYSPDTPVSAATMAGYYSPDDSPAAQAKFVDMYSTLNSDNQKKYANSGMNVSNKYKTNARSNHPFDIRALDKRISQRPLYHRSKANVQHSYMFGDYGRRKTPDWEQTTNPGAVQGPDFDSIYDRTVDDINKIKI